MDREESCKTNALNVISPEAANSASLHATSPGRDGRSVLLFQNLPRNAVQG
jgi:hypothetical protein